MLVAVVAVKEAGTFRLALLPNIIPAGLIKNKLALLPLTWIKPLITEGLFPFTRERIFWIWGEVMKLAVWLFPRLNCRKLWKRLAPLLETAPPVMSNCWSRGVTIVLVLLGAGTRGGGLSWGLTWAFACRLLLTHKIGTTVSRVRRFLESCKGANSIVTSRINFLGGGNISRYFWCFLPRVNTSLTFPSYFCQFLSLKTEELRIKLL